MVWSSGRPWAAAGNRAAIACLSLLLGAALSACAFSHPIVGLNTDAPEQALEWELALAGLLGGAGNGDSSSIPASIQGLSLFLQLDSLGLTNGQPAVALAGQDLGGYALSSEAWPIYSTTAVNGRPGLTFSNHSITIDVAGLAYNGLTVFLALHNDGGFAPVVHHGLFGSGSWVLSQGGSSISFDLFLSDGAEYAFIPDASGSHVLTTIASPADSISLYCDGQLIEQAPATESPANNGSMVMGTDGGEGNFQGAIGEFIVYNRALSDAERSLVEGYLMAKFGLLGGECPTEQGPR